MLAGLVGDISAKITEVASDSSDAAGRATTATPAGASTSEMFSPFMKIAQNVSNAAEFVSTAAQQRVASEFQSFESEAARAGATDALQEIERLKQLHATPGAEDPAARRLQFSIEDDAGNANRPAGGAGGAVTMSADAEFAAEDAAELRQMVNDLQEELRAHKSKTVRQALAQSDQHRREKRELEEQLQRACVLAAP